MLNLIFFILTPFKSDDIDITRLDDVSISADKLHQICYSLNEINNLGLTLSSTMFILKSVDASNFFEELIKEAARVGAEEAVGKLRAEMDDSWLTEEEASKRMNVSIQTVRKMISRGELTVHYAGSCKRLRWSEINAATRRAGVGSGRLTTGGVGLISPGSARNSIL